jgi:2-methylcitrate dehydratase
MNRRQFLIGTSALGSLVDTGAAQAEGATVSSERMLAAYAAAMRFEKLPPQVIEALKRLLIDTLACAFGAVGAEPVQIVERTFRQNPVGSGSATIIGGRTPLTIDGATLVNGVLVRYLDLNDIYAGGDPDHPSECIPAALACCEAAGRSGRDLLTAIAIGYETQLALVDAVGFGSRGFHSVSCAGFVTPLIAGKIWDLSEAQMAAAVGISGPKQMTLLAINSGPISMMKALVFPYGAMDGLMATRLAKEGFTGAGDVMEWFVQHTKGRSADFKLDLTTDHFRILNVGLKRFPVQFELQSVSEAGVELRRTLGARVSQISEIVVETSPRAREVTAGPSRYAPQTKETADHSLPICLAMALLDGDVTVRQFDEGRWKAPEVLALARKVRVEVFANAAPGDRSTRTHVHAVLTDGTSQDIAIERPDGDPRRPISAAGLSGKFMQFAEPVLGPKQARLLFDACQNIEQVSDVAQLTQLMRPE